MLRKVADYIPSFVFMADEKMNLYYINRKWLRFTKVKKENLFGKKWLDYVQPKDKKELLKTINSAVKKVEPFDFRFRMRHYNGTYRWIDIKARLAKEKGTDKIHFVGSGNEIHSIIKSEENSKKFMNFASHEIKTPLTAIQTYLEIVERRIKENNINEVPRFIKKVKSNITTLTELINSFLDITKAQTGKIIIDEKREDIAELVKKEAEQSKYIYKSHHIKLTKVETAIVLMDKRRITQVLDNIISNAVRYSSKNSVVTIYQSVIGDKAVIKIKDHGIGIPLSEQKKIFKKYYQLRKNPYKVVGMGMGLYLAKIIIKKHKGSIGLTSKVGKGTTFIIKLPIAS